MNNGSYIVNLGADPEPLTLGDKQLMKLRCADKTPGKRSVVRWITAMVGGPDIAVAARLAKGDSIVVVGTLTKTEYAPKKPRYKGEMIATDEIPFAKILQVVKSPTFFGSVPVTNEDVSAGSAELVTHAVTTGDFPPADDVSAPEMEGL